MAKSVIFTVDDEPQVLNAIERDLRAHYSGDYKILKAGSGREALSAILKLKRKNTPVALLLVDQRMPQMSGTDFIAEAKEIYPETKSVLLTAYADTEAAIQSINDLGLDFYLMKPWDPPEEHLYPVLDDLLNDWSKTAELPYEGIRVAGTLWSARSHNVKDFLARNKIPYKWLDIEKSIVTKKLVADVKNESGILPVVFFPDGKTLVAPTNRELAEKIGLQTKATKPFYDLIILGGGPAGLGAAVYGSSEGLRLLMIERKATGGQAGTSSWIENYLGFPKGLSGADLARRAVIQAKKFGSEILLAQEAIKIRVEDPYRYAILDDGTQIGCKALLLATGVTTQKLSKPGVNRLTGKGIYYGTAPTEAAYYQAQDVAIIGGSNSAGQGAMLLSRYAKRVFILLRGNRVGSGLSQYLLDQINSTKNIKIYLNTEVEKAMGKKKLESIIIANSKSGKKRKLKAGAMFIFIGSVPHSQVAEGVVERNERGLIITGQDLIRNGKRPKGWNLNRDPFLLETSVPGIFAAGDVRQGSLSRVSAAVGQGAIVVSLVHQYLKTV